jgi:LPS-assembly lipoprotein
MPLARQTIFILALMCFLSACGFQLRGAGGSELPESWRKMYLITNNPNSELSRELQSVFSASGVLWVDQEEANYLVKIGPEKFQQRNLSLNAQARAAEFELSLSSSFSVADANGTEAIESTRATVIKQMENDPRNVVGKAEEVRLLRAEMRTELVHQISRRIGFYAASTQ